MNTNLTETTLITPAIIHTNMTKHQKQGVNKTYISSEVIVEILILSYYDTLASG